MTPKNGLRPRRKRTPVRRWRWAIRRDVRVLPRVRRWFATCAARSGISLSARGAWQCTLVLIEAVNNAMVHANPRQRDKGIELALTFAPHRVTMAVTDSGPPFAAPSQRVPAVTRTRGRGWYLMRALCRRVTVQRRRGQNTVRMWYDEQQ